MDENIGVILYKCIKPKISGPHGGEYEGDLSSGLLCHVIL
jgi:hypothetical protein